MKASCYISVFPILIKYWTGNTSTETWESLKPETQQQKFCSQTHTHTNMQVCTHTHTCTCSRTHTHTYWGIQRNYRAKELWLLLNHFLPQHPWASRTRSGTWKTHRRETYLSLGFFCLCFAYPVCYYDSSPPNSDRGMTNYPSYINDSDIRTPKICTHI